MKKMTVLVSVENGCAAEKVMKLAKEKLGLKKGQRVLKKGNVKVLFASGIIQRSVQDVEELAKHKDYDMLVIPSFSDGVKAFPKIHDVKMYVNNTLGFTVFVAAVPPKPTDKDVDDSAENIADIVTANIGL
jgi:transaldolase